MPRAWILGGCSVGAVREPPLQRLFMVYGEPTPMGDCLEPGSFNQSRQLMVYIT